jgi:hypothetical protein
MVGRRNERIETGGADRPVSIAAHVAQNVADARVVLRDADGNAMRLAGPAGARGCGQVPGSHSLGQPRMDRGCTRRGRQRWLPKSGATIACDGHFPTCARRRSVDVRPPKRRCGAGGKGTSTRHLQRSARPTPARRTTKAAYYWQELLQRKFRLELCRGAWSAHGPARFEPGAVTGRPGAIISPETGRDAGLALVGMMQLRFDGVSDAV